MGGKEQGREGRKRAARQESERRKGCNALIMDIRTASQGRGRREIKKGAAWLSKWWLTGVPGKGKVPFLLPVTLLHCNPLIY